MPPLSVVPCDVVPAPGNLNAEIRENTLCIPAALAIQMRASGVRTAEDLVAYMAAFPSDVAEKLGWTLPNVAGATDRLRQPLRGKVPDAALQPATPPRPGFGAMDPDRLPPLP